MLTFRFNTLKKVQASGVLLRAEYGRMDRIRLLKLLYIADRESLQERGTPIVGGRVVAMKNGPLHSDIYDLIKGEHPQEMLWADHFENDGHVVVMLDDPGRLELSPYEIEKLVDVSERYKSIDTWDVAEMTHDFPEYIDIYRENTSTTIPLEVTLKYLGFTPDEIEQVRSDAESHASFVAACH